MKNVIKRIGGPTLSNLNNYNLFFFLSKDEDKSRIIKFDTGSVVNFKELKYVDGGLKFVKTDIKLSDGETYYIVSLDLNNNLKGSGICTKNPTTDILSKDLKDHLGTLLNSFDVRLLDDNLLPYNKEKKEPI